MTRTKKRQRQRFYVNVVLYRGDMKQYPGVQKAFRIDENCPLEEWAIQKAVENFHSWDYQFWGDNEDTTYRAVYVKDNVSLAPLWFEYARVVKANYVMRFDESCVIDEDRLYVELQKHESKTMFIAIDKYDKRYKAVYCIGDQTNFWALHNQIVAQYSK